MKYISNIKRIWLFYYFQLVFILIKYNSIEFVIMEKQVSSESFISAQSLSFVFTNNIIQRDTSIVDDEFKEDLDVLEFQLCKINPHKEIEIAREQLCLIPKRDINEIMAIWKPPQIVDTILSAAATLL